MIQLERVTFGAVVPAKATKLSACFDICADIEGRNIKTWHDNNFESVSENTACSMWLAPGKRALIPTGWKMQCAPDFRIAIYPRSGLSIKNGISLINCVGVIDADYTDEVHITIVNHSDETFQISQGDRLAQLALERVEPCEMVVVDKLSTVDSDRVGGLGSTGV